jgi:phospholipase C
VPLPPLAMGVAGPIGLGWRVPLFARNRSSEVWSKTSDDTKPPRLDETRFGAEVPGLSAWRRAAVGDLTAALDFAAPDVSLPRLPSVPAPDGAGPCTAPLTTYPRPRRPPTQPHRKPRRPSGIV